MAQPRKPFRQLAPDTQTRKERWYAKHQGLTAREVQQRYDAGTLGSQKAARGHANDENRIKQAIDFIYRFKENKWSRRPKWNPDRARKNISHDPETGKKRTITQLKVIENMVKLAISDELDWHDIVALDYEYESAFYYH